MRNGCPEVARRSLSEWNSSVDYPGTESSTGEQNSINELTHFPHNFYMVTVFMYTLELRQDTGKLTDMVAPG